MGQNQEQDECSDACPEVIFSPIDDTSIDGHASLKNLAKTTEIRYSDYSPRDYSSRGGTEKSPISFFGKTDESA